MSYEPTYMDIICQYLKRIAMAIEKINPDISKIKEEIESEINVSFAKIMNRLTALEEQD